ncbi:MAG: broad-spectrum mercury transporter MerE [Acidiferrobacterales bacterium]
MTTLRGESSRHRRGYLYALLAVVTCPCHLPVFAVLLSGSAVGAFLSDHFGTALTIFSLLFVFSLAAALRVLRGKQAHGN